jgi:hypothetical protein
MSLPVRQAQGAMLIDRPVPFFAIGGTGTPLVSGSVGALSTRRRVAEPAGARQRFQRRA